MATLNFAAELSHDSSQTLPDEVINTQTPIILRNFISNWPLTEISQKSISDAVEYLLKFYNQQPVNIVIGESDTAQRIFYNEDFSGFNFKTNN